MPALVRPASFDDVGAIQAIYAHHVLNGLGTFEETPPDADEMRRRMEGVLAQDGPWLVAELDGQVAAYAYAAPFRPARPIGSPSRTASMWPRAMCARASDCSFCAN